MFARITVALAFGDLIYWRSVSFFVSIFITSASLRQHTVKRHPLVHMTIN